MNLELFIAKRLHYEQKGKKRVSKTAVKIAVLGTAIGTAVMIIAMCVITGFKNEIREKLIGFSSHYQICGLSERGSIDCRPISVDSFLMSKIQKIDGVEHAQRICNYGAILKTDEDVQGIVFKGVDCDYSWDFFKSSIVDGRIAEITKDSISKEAVISSRLAQKMNLSVGDKMRIYFVLNGKIRVRPLTITGLYNTGFTDFDDKVVVADLRHLQRLNSWSEDKVTHVEIQIADFNTLDEHYDKIFRTIGNRFDEDGNPYILKSVKELSPQIFAWLEMLDINVAIILVLMICVAGFTIASSLLILILERTNMIGVLFALGENSWSIRKIFLYQSLFLVGKGMLIGNVVSIALCWLQMQFHLIPLAPETYYVDHVPAEIVPSTIILLNIGIAAISTMILIAPTYIIKNISPAEAIRFE